MAACEDAAFHDGLRSAFCLLGGLKNQHDVAGQCFSVRFYALCQGQDHGHVAIVAAGVHFAGMAGGIRL